MSNEEIFKKYNLKTEEVSSGVYLVKNFKESMIDVYAFEGEFNNCCVYAKMENVFSSNSGFIYLIITENHPDTDKIHELTSAVSNLIVVGGYDKESIKRVSTPSLISITFGDNYNEHRRD